METTEDHWEKLFGLKQNCGFPDFGTELQEIKSYNINHKQKTTEQTAEGKSTESSRANTTKYRRQKEQKRTPYRTH